MPTLFLAHGAPPVLDMPEWLAELHALATALPRPRSVLMLSAHWETKPIAVGATRTVPLVYDFYGFPERYYQVKYPAPGAPQLAERVLSLLEPHQGVAQEPDRGLDHGAFVPLLAMYPQADVPVLQLSLPSLQAPEMFALGKQLAPLRDEGVLIIGSGFITHNLRSGISATTPQWARDFDGWVAEALHKKNVDALLDYRQKAPGVRESLPTHEHFVPLLTAVGAAPDEKVAFPIDGFWLGGFTRRSAVFG
ncbi:MAG: dioxygenase [Archangiaceae bacterium]|nr:dioxygenase [Archangiaceae bacterium]